MFDNRYINPMKTSLEFFQNSHVPLHSSKFSKREQNQHQLLSLIFLKEDIGKDYYDFAELIQIMSSLRESIGLYEILHFTSLQEFMTRVPLLTFRIILKNVLHRLHRKVMKLRSHL